MTNTEENWLYGISAKQEYSEPIDGELSGEIPSWISGNLYRNGPALMEVGDTKYNHFFDGLAMIQKYDIRNGKVSFRSKYLRSEAFNKNMAANRIVVSEFGTMAFPDPCKNIFKRYISLYIPHFTDNASVNIAPYGDELYAMTETATITRIDPGNLDTIGRHAINNFVAVNGATAHPHVDPDGTLHNLGSSHNSSGPTYNIITIPNPDPGQPALQKATIKATVISRWKMNPGYSHSFGMTENYYIILESPLTISLPKFAKCIVTRSGLSEAMTWWKGEKTIIHVINKSNGLHVNRYTADGFFTFHHINAYEESGYIVMDLVGYESGEFVGNLTIKSLNGSFPNMNPHVRRYILPLEIGTDNLVKLSGTSATASLVKKDITIHCEFEVLGDLSLEMPTINYRKYNTHKYQFCYGIVTVDSQKLLGKLDVVSKTHITWSEEHCNPTEPIFIPRPEATEEDDGVLVASILRIKDNDRSQFLIVLDGKTLKEVGRAEFPTVSIPFGFHGLFMPTK